MASEKKRQYQKEWWAKHREQKNAKRLRHYYKHREEILEKRKAKYELMKLDLGHLRDNPALIKALAGYLASHFYRGEYERLGLELSPSLISRENR